MSEKIEILNRLFLNANPITSNGLSHLASMRSLRFLDLGGTKMRRRRLIQIAKFVEFKEPPSQQQQTYRRQSCRGSLFDGRLDEL